MWGTIWVSRTPPASLDAMPASAFVDRLRLAISKAARPTTELTAAGTTSTFADEGGWDAADRRSSATFQVSASTQMT